MFFTLYHIILMHVRCRKKKAFLISSLVSKPVLLGITTPFFKKKSFVIFGKLINCAMHSPRASQTFNVKQRGWMNSFAWHPPRWTRGWLASPAAAQTDLHDLINTFRHFVCKYDVRYILNCKSRTFLCTPRLSFLYHKLNEEIVTIRTRFPFRLIMHRSWSIMIHFDVAWCSAFWHSDNI